MFESTEVACKAFRPLQDWVLMKAPKPEQKTIGRIIQPSSKRDFASCEVLAVGPKCEIKVGQKVWIQRFATEGDLRFKLNGEYVFIMREAHVNVVLNEEPVVDSKSKGRKKAA